MGDRLAIFFAFCAIPQGIREKLQNIWGAKRDEREEALPQHTSDEKYKQKRHKWKKYEENLFRKCVVIEKVGKSINEKIFSWQDTKTGEGSAKNRWKWGIFEVFCVEHVEKMHKFFGAQRMWRSPWNAFSFQNLLTNHPKSGIMIAYIIYVIFCT